MRVGLLLCLLLSGVALQAQQAPDPKSLFLVTDFNEGIQNRLGGYYNKFESAPASASVYAVPEVYRGEAGRSLKIRTKFAPGGFCGGWMQFFDMKADQKKFFDTRNFAFLSFWVKGEKGGENFTIKMADESWIAKEDAVAIGDAKQFLPGGVTKEWQEVLVPLGNISNLDRMNMGGVTFDFSSPAEQTVYIDDVAFKTSPKIVTPITKKGDVKAVATETIPRAMWCWETEPILTDPAYRKKLFELCKKEKINQLWVQLMYDLDPAWSFENNEPPPANLKATLKKPEQLREFLREAHAAGLTVHGLDGFPEFAQKEYHLMPQAIADAAIAYNKSSKAEERFDGLHFDNEPYLIIGWRDWTRREEILKEFLDLNTALKKKANDNGMVFGVDIPFWWQEKDEKTGKVAGLITYNGVNKPASFHCIDLLDNVGIMNYRDTADGADGIVEHGRGLLEYGDKAKKAKLFMGVETFTYQPTETWFAVGLPKKEFEAALKDKAKDFANRSRINGFRTQILDDGNNFHVGIEMKPKPTPEEEKKAVATLVEIAKRFGASAHPSLKDKADSIRMDGEFGVSADPEWDNARAREIVDPVTKTKYAGFVATSIMLQKITFADENYDDIRFQLGAAEAEFRKHPSFAGFAIHYYDTFLKKVEEAR